MVFNRRMMVRSACGWLFLVNLWINLCVTLCSVARADQRPNVVVIMTDDQGYGDLSCHGNPVLKTPALDHLFAQSVRLTDYHVSPTCSPTRAAFLTGRWSNRTGVWHTIMGRSMLRDQEVTMGDVFRANGYATGMFGKWHLGDNYPYRAEDRGFDEVLRHGGGGIGQTPDYWDNAYFDGSYWYNGTPTPVSGFCTNVFFDYARQFIATQQAAGKPFFAYLATNAPHGPMHAPVEYSRPYQQHGVAVANFFGMIANIDENVGRLRAFLDEVGIADQTILIFTTDNGSSAGTEIFNAGMRGGKGSQFDGGHRVPCFIHWPRGGLVGGTDVDRLTGHVDLLPTLIDLCDLQPPDGVAFDGDSLAPLLRNEQRQDWPERILVTDSQRVKDPIKWRQSAVLTDRWRLIDGQQLFDIQADPGQLTDLAAQHPHVVIRLREFYEQWWAELEPTFDDATAIWLGHAAEPVVRLTSHDWITTHSTPWNQAHIRSALSGAGSTGYWNVNVVEPGSYRIRLRRWPSEMDRPIDAPLPPGDAVPGQPAYRQTPGRAIHPATAQIRIGDISASAPVVAGQREVLFQLELPAGKQPLLATFETTDGQIFGAYYVYVSRQSADAGSAE